MANAVETILAKRDGAELAQSELANFFNAYLSGDVPEYQMSAFLMATFFKGMTAAETAALTKVYIDSGKRLRFDASLKTVDKHSTGGVGDKITLMLAPLVAACGAVVPMISGRGLGHTGGTLDKLEAIPGLRTNFEEDDFRRFIDDNNFAIISQSNQLVPADKRIYALRDVTGTVESLNLITASIMSKKLAEGADHLVIDLKVGSGAFMQTLDNAKKLAALLKGTGEALGQKVKVVFTSMSRPLGRAVGNALEVAEAINWLKGEDQPDTTPITETLAAEMLTLCGRSANYEQALQRVRAARQDGSALKYFARFIELQGGNPKVVDDLSLLPGAKYSRQLLAPVSGYVSAVNSRAIGYALVGLGAGRKTLESPLDYGAGALLDPQIGQYYQKGQPMGTLWYNKASDIDATAARIEQAYTFAEQAPQVTPIIIDKL